MPPEPEDASKPDADAAGDPAEVTGPKPAGAAPRGGPGWVPSSQGYGWVSPPPASAETPPPMRDLGGASPSNDAPPPPHRPRPDGWRGTLSDIWDNRWGRIAAISGGALLIVGIVGWNVLFFGMPKLPRADELWTINRQPAVQFVDASGRTLAVRGHLYGPVVRGAELPPYVGQAFIAAEDQRFMQHGGVDVQSIMRATFANVSARHTVQGGSTLTQQLVKNLLVGDEQSLRRKAQEARLAGQMEKKLSKAEILDLYLNRVYLGSNAYGVEAAARTYFGKPSTKLTLAEAAFLAALPKAPTRYGADRTSPETVARVHYVLDRMVESKFITPKAAAAAKALPLKFLDDAAQAPITGYVLDQAMGEVHALVPDLPADAVITLTVDRDLQRQSEAALNAALSVRGLGASQGAVVVLDRSGGIRALVGGRDYSKSQFNRATQAQRQPGSTFKTFVYAAALEHGLTPDTIRNDEPVQMAGWQPGNYEDNYLGPITLAKALAISSNSVAAQVGVEIGPKSVAELAKRFGVASPLSAYPSIALGADEVNLLEMTGAYGVLANDGRRLQTHIVSQIRDQRGEILYAAPEPAEPQVYDPGAAATLTGMLSNVVRFGTGAKAQIPGWQIAGKTGTSQSWRDAWFVGYSARLIGGVWIGNDDDKAMRKVTGGGAAAALFAKVMTAAHRGLRPEPLRGAELGPMWLDSTFFEEMPQDMPGDPDAAPPRDDQDDEDDAAPIARPQDAIVVAPQGGFRPIAEPGAPAPRSIAPLQPAPRDLADPVLPAAVVAAHTP